MTTPLLDCVELTTGHGQPRHAVIWLHGLGADGHDFAGIVPELNLPDDLPVRFVFPHAPMIPVTINHGYLLRAWYDILHADGACIEAAYRSRVDDVCDYPVISGIHPSCTSSDEIK